MIQFHIFQQTIGIINRNIVRQIASGIESILFAIRLLSFLKRISEKLVRKMNIPVHTDAHFLSHNQHVSDEQRVVSMQLKSNSTSFLLISSSFTITVSHNQHAICRKGRSHHSNSKTSDHQHSSLQYFWRFHHLRMTR